MGAAAIYRAQRDAEIVRMAAEGMLMKDIAVALGITPNYPGAILKRMGVERPSKPQRRPRDAVDPGAIAKLWRSGLAVSAIAEALRMPTATVHRVLLKTGARSKGSAMRTRYDVGADGGSGRSGFAGNMARRT